MFKVNVKSNISAEVVNRLRKTVTQEFVENMNKEAVGEAKRMIRAGVSPVQATAGGRRFAGYKDPEKYPALKKAKRPVNLELSGIMLMWYSVTRISGVRLSFGIPKDAPSDVKDRAEANNVGTYNDQGEVAIAARRFIPLKGETFAVSVMRKIKKLYAQRIKELLSSKRI